MAVLFIVLILSSLIPTNLLEVVANFFKPLHNFCIARLPSGEGFEISSALLCGQSIYSNSWRNLLSRSSLFHVVIVAKTHLLLIALIIEKLLMGISTKLLKFGILLILGVYVAMSAWQAPLVRCLVSGMLLLCSQYFRWNWNSSYLLLISALTCLLLNPLWIDSLSLLHSCGCAAAFLLARRFSPDSWKNQAGLGFLLTVPFLWGWGNIHPLGLVFNLLLSPLMLILWLPGAVLVFLFPSVNPLWQQMLAESSHAILPLLDPIPVSVSSEHVSTPILWSVFAAYFLLDRALLARKQT